MEDLLIAACKQLHFNVNIIGKAKRLGNAENLEFLLKLFTAEIEERDINRRNLYQKTAKFDVLKTFEKYTFEDIKFPKTISPEGLRDAVFVPKKQNLILYGNTGSGKTHLATAIGIAACGLGYRTRFWRVPNLVNALVDAKKQGSITAFMKQFDKKGATNLCCSKNW